MSAAAIFVLCLVVFLINGRPHPEVDCVAAPYVAWSLVRQGSFDLTPYSDLDRYVGGVVQTRSDGVRVSRVPPGSALAAVPFVAPIALLRERPLRDTDMHHVGKLAAAVMVSGAAAFLFVICRRLAPAGAWPATLLFAFGTCLYSVASQALWMHGPAVFWLCGALYFLTRADNDAVGCRLAAGLALGLAVLTRPSTAFFAVSTVVALAAARRWRGVTWVIAGGALPGSLLLYYNSVNFDHAVVGGYWNEPFSASSPLWLGLSGLLIAPSRGVIVYSPAVLVALPGFWTLVRRHDEASATARPIVIAWLAAAAVTVVFFARWYEWRGGWSYGPRYLCETMPVLCLLVAMAYDGFWKQWQRRVAHVLVAISVSIHVIGVFGYSGYEAWQRRHPAGDQGRSLFALEDTQIEAHTRALLKKLMALGTRPAV